jgi:hypothetical protein
MQEIKTLEDSLYHFVQDRYTKLIIDPRYSRLKNISQDTFVLVYLQAIADCLDSQNSIEKR